MRARVGQKGTNSIHSRTSGGFCAATSSPIISTIIMTKSSKLAANSCSIPPRTRPACSSGPGRRGRGPWGRADPTSASARLVVQAARAPCLGGDARRMRSTVSSHSNSAMPASKVPIMRPWGVDRSNVIPFSVTRDTRRASSSSKVDSRSVVLRPQRDSSVTSTASISRPCARTSTLRRSARSIFTPGWHATPSTTSPSTCTRGSRATTSG